MIPLVNIAVCFLRNVPLLRVFQRLLSDPVVTWWQTGVVLSKSVSTWCIMQQDLKIGPSHLSHPFFTAQQAYIEQITFVREIKTGEMKCSAIMMCWQCVIIIRIITFSLGPAPPTSLSHTLLLHQLPFVTMETLSSHPFSPSSNPSIKRQSSIPRLHPLSLSLPRNNGPYQGSSVYFNVS